MGDIICPVCGLGVWKKAWLKHVYAHKLEWCRRNNKPETFVDYVLWQDVLSYFRPVETGGQLRLGEFGGGGK